MIHDDDAALGHRRDIGGTAAAGQAEAFAVLFDPVGVQVAEAIDFSAADKTELDPSRLQKKHNVVETRARERAGNIGWIAHGENRFERRPVADNAIFKNTKGSRRMRFFRYGKSQQ